MWSSHRGVIGDLTRALSASALRQKVIAHNLANFNTPGFKRYAVSFEEQLARARGALPLERTHRRHRGEEPGEVVPAVKVDRSAVRRVDGNNIDLETEMVALVTNQLRYNAYIQQVNNRFSRWRYVINEGRR
jgi:flagellar basal-body rod protein FlgB